MFAYRRKKRIADCEAAGAPIPKKPKHGGMSMLPDGTRMTLPPRCKKCTQPAISGNYGFCARHREMWRPSPGLGPYAGSMFPGSGMGF